MFSETKDVEFLNYIANHQDVRAGGEFDVDVSPLLEQGIAYSYDNGAIIYVFKGCGIYEAHTQALKAGRGKILREFIRWTLEDMFKNKAAEKITSYAYDSNPAAKKIAAEFLKPCGTLYELDREVFLCH